jgi:RecA/RadA recombinase
MGLRSKEMRSLFKSFTLALSNLKVPFIFTNHTYASMDQYTPKGMSGGGGPEFSASIILMLSKGTLRDEAKTTTGIIVRSKTKKNRLAKPIDIEFHISFHKGMNPFVGLEQYVSWENCGVGRGNKLTEKEFSKLKPDEAALCSKFELNGETFYFFPKKLGKNYIIRHNGDEVPVKQFFSNRLFTDDVLKELDEKIIKPTFKYPETQEEIGDLETEELGDLNEDSNEF